jgi:hypothetical protein
MSANPEAASQPSGSDETIVLRGTFVEHGKVVPMGHGWDWIAAAWSIFARAAGLWIGMVLTLVVITIVLMIVPFIGPLALSVLWPVFVAGLMMASRTIDQGGEPQFVQLFGGFKHRFGPLVVLGVISLVISTVLVVLVVAITGVQLFMLIGPDSSPEMVLAAAARILLAVLLLAALLLPLVMATWFAPALIVFHELGAPAAMKASFIGCLKNTLPFLLYGVILLVAAAVASVPFGLGWLVLGPVTVASVYTAYRDIYFSE